MNLKESVVRLGRNIEAFAAALSYSDQEDIEARVRKLEIDGQSQMKRLLALTDQVQALSDGMNNADGWRA
jgi:hypothetical protein